MKLFSNRFLRYLFKTRPVISPWAEERINEICVQLGGNPWTSYSGFSFSPPSTALFLDCWMPTITEFSGQSTMTLKTGFGILQETSNWTNVKGGTYMEYLEDGDECPECGGEMGFEEVENCECYISSPCYQCLDNPLVCLKCGWRASVYSYWVQRAKTKEATMQEQIDETGQAFFRGVINAIAIMGTGAFLIWLGKCFIDVFLG